MFKVDNKTLSYYAGWIQFCRYGNILQIIALSSTFVLD